VIEVVALYFLGEDFLGHEDLPETSAYLRSRIYLCENCGNSYGKLVITRNGIKNLYGSWAGLCSNCSPEKGGIIYTYPGGQPFFDFHKSPPKDAILRQLLSELDYYYASNKISATLPTSGSECSPNGPSGDG
jgi:hypothetical protein